LQQGRISCIEVAVAAAFDEGIPALRAGLQGMAVSASMWGLPLPCREMRHGDRVRCDLLRPHPRRTDRLCLRAANGRPQDPISLATLEFKAPATATRLIMTEQGALLERLRRQRKPGARRCTSLHSPSSRRSTGITGSLLGSGLVGSASRRRMLEAPAAAYTNCRTTGICHPDAPGSGAYWKTGLSRRE